MLIYIKIPFTALIAENPTLELLRANEQTRVVEDKERFEVYSTYSAQGIPFEMYRVRLHQGCRRDAEPHGFGVLESVTVFSGNLTIEIGSDTYTLHPGDALSFAADITHVYLNVDESICEISMSIYYQAGSQKP